MKLIEKDLGHIDEQDNIRWGVGKTPIGPACIAWSHEGVRWLSLGECSEELLACGLRFLSQSTRLTRDDHLAEQYLNEAFERTLRKPLVLHGTPFQRKVWRALLDIPTGETVSYSEIAQKIGYKSAARAVGSAVGANNIAYLIPCHRVIRRDGVIGQFRWGTPLKTALLRWEGLYVPNGCSGKL
jgi:AraC family transcriptional regulator, regulatory protein of adaptative response / methylated-DNA-[protein]-cysteine methyltransferase